MMTPFKILALAASAALIAATPVSAQGRHGGPSVQGGHGWHAGGGGYHGHGGRGYYRGHYRGHGGWGNGGWGVGAGLATGLIVGGALAAANGPYVDADAHEAYCMQRFRSYDPASGTYLGYDGLRHPC